MVDNGEGELLKDVCDDVIADTDLEPRDGKTFCNIGARRVAQAMGCHDFDDEDLCADDMISIMENGSQWSRATGSEATIHALGGGLAFAAMPSARLGEAHGHLAALYPVGMGWSGSLAKDVPYVANVGRQNGEEKVSEAFPVKKGEPNYFIWTKGD
jgi:hypothetical protein